MFQLNEFPTHFTDNKSHILDLIISNDPECLTNIKSIFPDSAGISTDHHLLEFDVIIWNCRMKKRPCYVYNFKFCNITQLKDAIRQSTTPIGIFDTPNAVFAWNTWKTELYNNHVPKVKVRSSATPPWFDGEVIHLLKRK